MIVKAFPPRALNWIYLLALALASAGALYFFVTPSPDNNGLNLHRRTKFLEMVNGTAFQPYVSRVLVPLMLRAADLVTPQQVKDGFADTVANDATLSATFAALHWETSAAYLYCLACLIVWLQFMGFGHMTARLAIATLNLPNTPAISSSLALPALLLLPGFFRYTSYLYDPATLFLYTLALYYIARGNSKGLAAAFVLASINKETTLLLLPVIVLAWRTRIPLPRLLALLGALLAVYLFIRLPITYLFHNNRGSVVEFHLYDHTLPYLQHAWTPVELVFILGVTFLLFFGWHNKPPFLRMAFLCTLLPQLGLGFFFGFIDEWRVYYESYALAFLLIAGTLIQCWELAQHREARESTALPKVG